MYKLVPYQDVNAQTETMPKWLEMMIQCSKVAQTQICLVSVEVFIQILYFDVSKSQTVMNIQRLIATNSSSSQEKFDPKLMKNPLNFRQHFLTILQQSQYFSDNNNEEIEDTSYEGSDCKDIILNLWSLLDNEVQTTVIVMMLKSFDQLVPKIFSYVVIEDLKEKKGDKTNITAARKKQERAIKRFSVFWKNTSNDYPIYKPFEGEMSGGMEKVKKYSALHKMINFLEDPDPTFRLSCRSWLS